MGVYVKGMDMPRSCLSAGNDDNCPFLALCKVNKDRLLNSLGLSTEDWIAVSTERVEEMFKGRIEGCPLVEVDES